MVVELGVVVVVELVVVEACVVVVTGWQTERVTVLPGDTCEFAAGF